MLCIILRLVIPLILSQIRYWMKSNQMLKKFYLICVFVQGLLLCPQTLSQTRRARLRRAFTEATGDTVTYVKTVGTIGLCTAKTTIDCTIFKTMQTVNKFCKAVQTFLCIHSIDSVGNVEVWIVQHVRPSCILVDFTGWVLGCTVEKMDKINHWSNVSWRMCRP